jgi:hypothetical protein
MAVLALVASLSLPTAVEGQVPWEAPFLVSTSSPPGLSVMLADPAHGIGLIGLWQGRGGPVRLGYRVGLAEDRSDDLAVLGGIDFSGPVLSHSVNFPLDIAWVAGVGLGVSDYALLSVPVGVSFGRVVVEENVRVHPYVTPRLVVDAFLGDDHGLDDDMDLGLAVDLGVDVAFEGNWMIRFAGVMGDREALAIGLAFPFL